MDGWIQHAHMMNYMKLFGLGITKENYLFVNDRRSKGCPHVFWRHNHKCKSVEHVHWEVGTGDNVDVARSVKKPDSLRLY